MNWAHDLGASLSIHKPISSWINDQRWETWRRNEVLLFFTTKSEETNIIEKRKGTGKKMLTVDEST